MVRNAYWMRDSAIILIGLIALSFVTGVDHELDKADQATKQDRLRLHCAAEPWDAMCLAK